MKIIHQLSNLVTRHLRKFGLMQSLTFDQQVWGAKSVMDLVEFDSRFMLAEADTGGTTDALISGELSVPVQDSNEGIRLALFTDIGNVWGAGEDMEWSDLRTAVGFGVRFPIMIPVALDFAWLLDAKDGESSSQIQFTLGQFRY